MSPEFSSNAIASSLDMDDPLAWLAGVNEPLARRLRATAQESVYLVRPRGVSEGVSGLTRLGGVPHLPVGVRWPAFRGRPMAFLLQVDLSTVAALGRTDLPQDGLLAFFADIRHGPEFEALGSWHVVYSESAAAVVPCPPPPDLEDILRAPHTQPELVLGPSYEQLWDEELDELCPGRDSDEDEDEDDDSQLEEETYFNWRTAVRSRLGGHEVHQLLGHPEQAGACYDLRSLASRANPGTESGDWRLLLQLDSMHNRLPARFPTGGSAWMWGDAGKLQFWILRSDLAAARFDRTFMNSLSG